MVMPLNRRIFSEAGKVIHNYATLFTLDDSLLYFHDNTRLVHVWVIYRAYTLNIHLKHFLHYFFVTFQKLQ
jgi:hypothetical protein